AVILFFPAEDGIRYSRPGWASSSPSPARSIAPHHHGRAGARHGPAEVGGDLASLDLPAAALPVVVGVPAPAVRADGAAVVGVVPQLAHVLDHHAHAVRVALAQMAAAGVVGPPAAEPDGAVADIPAAVALVAEPVVLELQHGGEGEGVVGAGDVDVLRAHAGIGPEDLARVLSRHRRDRPVLVVHVDARLAHAPGHATDQHPGMRAIARPLGAGDDDGRGVVGLHAAVEQVQRLADDAAGEHLLNRDALLIVGLRIVGGVLAV